MIELIQYCPERKMVKGNELLSPPERNLAVFDETTIAFLNRVSRLLLTDKKFNHNPEIAALGFWLRSANIEAMKRENLHWLNSNHFTINPLGRVFHIAPSNVDTIFLYSLCISLLMGNSNIVRVSSAFSSPAVDFIIDCINKALAEDEHAVLKEHIRIITYSHDDAINTFLSSHANCRVIWGGDATVLHFKSIPAPVYCRDIVFPNRVSYSLFSATAYLTSTIETKQTLAHDFFNDAYTFDQLGCSSPKVIFVLGSEDEKKLFVTDFYKHLDTVAKKRYYSQTALLSVQKYNHLIDDIITNNAKVAAHEDNAVYIVETKEGMLKPESCFGGYFYVKGISDINMLAEITTETAQTLTCFGLTENERTELNKALYGKRIDRIVPVGQALSFHYIWDGMNLFEELSRKRVVMNQNTKKL